MCKNCGYRWREHSRRNINYEKHYKEWLLSRKTLKTVSNEIGKSVKTVRKYFDELEEKDSLLPAPKEAINLIFDATYFGREYGYMCFCDGEKIVYHQEIVSESVAMLEECLTKLREAGYRFKSFTLDGKPGFISCLAKLYPKIPIQFCHFHQQAIVRRYITQNPKSDSAKDLKYLMTKLTKSDPQSWINDFHALEKLHQNFLLERNENGGFLHSRLRSAFRSINNNIPFLFTYKNYPNLSILNTTNHLESRFSHLKEKIKLHRGLDIKRKKKAISFLLKNS